MNARYKFKHMALWFFMFFDGIRRRFCCVYVFLIPHSETVKLETENVTLRTENEDLRSGMEIKNDAAHFLAELVRNKLEGFQEVSDRVQQLEENSRNKTLRITGLDEVLNGNS